jgi:hypothetical protein
MTSTRKPAPPPNPAGLAPRDLRTIFATLRTQSSDAEALYEELTAAPELPFGEFLRWCLGHLPEVPLSAVLDVFAFWEREGRDALPHVAHADAISLFARLELTPEPGAAGRLEGYREGGLIAAFAPFFAADFAPFRTLYRERLAQGAWAPDACHAFWLVDWLLGEEIPAEEIRSLGRWRAYEHYWSFNSSPRSHPLYLAPLARRAGLTDVEDRTLAIALLGAEGFRAALEALRGADPDWTFERVVDLLEPLPLAVAVPRLIEGDRSPGARMAEAYAEYARRRPEPPAELLRVARSLSAVEPRPRLAELLCLAAAERWLDAGEPVPTEVDELLTLRLAHDAPLPMYRAVLPRLPNARRLALVERDLAHAECRGISAVALTDDELVDASPLAARVLAHARLNPIAVGQLGGRAAELIERRLQGAVDPALRPRLETALLEAAATHVKLGGAFDARWAFYLILAPPLSEAVATLYDHLPEPDRSDLLLDAVREYRVPGEVLSAVARHGLREELVDDFIAAYRARETSAHVGPLPGRLGVLGHSAPPPDTFTPALERLRVLAANGPEPREAVYVCQLVPARLADPAPSLTLFGGPPPVAPKSRPGPELRHVLTIDLRDVPELLARFPGARAASLFTPRDAGQSAKVGRVARVTRVAREDAASHAASFWRAFSESEVEPGSLSRPRTLIVHRCLVPETTFGAQGDQALRAALASFPGYLLGGPIPLQEGSARRSPTFVAQLSDDFDLPLGDHGRLYSYADHATWDSL